MIKDLWSSFGKEVFVQFLALLIVVAWLCTIFLHITGIDQTLTNVVMIVIGFFFGSSSGSKKKDDVLIPPPQEK